MTRPTEAVDAVADEAVGRPPSAVLLLVVDQFDEVFTALDPAERDEFLAAVVGHGGRRAAWWSPCGRRLMPAASSYPELARLVGANTLLVAGDDDRRAARRGPPSRRRWPGSICRPAWPTGSWPTPRRRPGDLTSLSTALRLSWANRTGRTLTPDGYAAARWRGAGRSSGTPRRSTRACTAAERDTARTILVHWLSATGGPRSSWPRC